MTRFRSFRNSDPPALVELWNQAIPEPSAVRPLRVHELDIHAFGSVYFDPEGLIVAESEGRIVGFVHAGFGPEDPVPAARPFTLGTELGTIAMLVMEPRPDADELARELVLEAERYLRRRGAKVLYGGGQLPLNPFYWGLYGGSEFSGIVGRHPIFPRLLVELGYEPVSTSVLLEADLSQPEPRDPRTIVIRRQTQIEYQEEALPHDWWQSLALSAFQLTRVGLLSRSGQELAHAFTWDMSWFGRGDGRTRIGLIDLEVNPEHRRKGFGRFLVGEIFRTAREHSTDLIEVQTLATNQPALALYASLGFQPIDQATLFRLPAHLTDRSAHS